MERKRGDGEEGRKKGEERLTGRNSSAIDVPDAKKKETWRKGERIKRREEGEREGKDEVS